MSSTKSLEDLKGMEIDFPDDAPDTSQYRNYTKSIALTIGYMLGVKEEHLKIIDKAAFDLLFEKLERNENAKAIRHLNNIRSNIMLQFKSLSRALRDYSADYKPIYKMEFFEDDFKALTRLGIQIVTGQTDLNEYLSIINKEICRRIDGTKGLFPEWVEFRHIKFMFNMNADIRAESEKYQINQNYYPYKRYFCWQQPSAKGNLLINDLRILETIYLSNGDYFQDQKRVMDASDHVKNNISDFINEAEKLQIFIDGENVDPYCFASALDGLDNGEIEKINKIVIYYDQVFSTRAWEVLKLFARGVEIETIPVERIIENKSLVDHKLVAGVSKAIYKEDVDSVILVSSDSDFWSVIEDVDAKYMVLVESDKCGQTFKEMLRAHDIFYCYLDKFIIPEKDQYFQSVFRYELKRILSRDSVLPNARVLFDEALRQSRATITGSQKEKLYNKYIKGLKLSIDKDGNIEIVVPEIE